MARWLTNRNITVDVDKVRWYVLFKQADCNPILLPFRINLFYGEDDSITLCFQTEEEREDFCNKIKGSTSEEQKIRDSTYNAITEIALSKLRQHSHLIYPLSSVHAEKEQISPSELIKKLEDIPKDAVFDEVTLKWTERRRYEWH